MKTMPKDTKEERYRWLRPILDEDMTIKALTKVSPFSERTIKYWLANYRKSGIEGLRAKSTRPKTQPRETTIRIRERIIELRRETRFSALKLKWYLAEQGIDIHHRTIGKILKREGLTRKYRVRKIKYLYVRALLQPGELVEIDIKYVPNRIKGRRYYQYTAIDSASRWRYLRVLDDCSSHSAMIFLKELVKVSPFQIRAVKTDNDSCFTNRYTGYLKSTDPLNPRLHAFDLLCRELSIEHYLIDPGKPQQNGKVERSHRTDQECFYDRTTFKNPAELQYKLRLWNMYYNDIKHCSLNGRSPNQALRLWVQYVRT